ncbi:MAG: hypothetical protein M3Z24_12265 [Chloroflexota bacterium]|nr:hypothetical protein [Chloroflexota bacterium]
MASSTQLLVSALTAAKSQGWISDETAMRLLFQFAGEEVDIHDEQFRIQKESFSCPSPDPNKAAQQAMEAHPPR